MAMDGAAANGHLDVVKWLHWSRHEGCTTTAIDRAATNGHLEIVQWLHKNRSEGCTTFAMDKAAARPFHLPSCNNRDSMQCCQKLAPFTFQENQLAIVQWLCENRTEGCTTRAMDGAAANGNLEMLQWLQHNTEAGCTDAAMKDAAANGYVHVVQWLHDVRSLTCTESIMKKAAADGNLEMTKWLQANYPGWEPEIAMEEAARYGHFGYCYYDQVQHGDGYSSHHHERVPSVTSESAKAAQFAAMNAVSQAKPPTNIPEVTTSIILDFLDSSLASAIESGPSESVGLVDLIWAKSLRDAKSDLWTVARLLQCEPHYYQWEFSQALLQAVRREDRGVIEWLEAHFPGCPVTCAVVEEIASRGWLWLLQLLLPGRGRKGIRASSEALDNAASNGHWDVVHWLVENASDASTKSSSSLVAISVSTNNLKELVWLMGRGYESIPEFPECTEVEWPTRKEIFIHVLQQVEWMAASALSQAAQHDDIRFAKWVMAHYDTTTGNSALQYSAQTASKHGCVAILRWLLKRLHALGKCDDLSEIMFVAAENGKVEVVKRLCKKYAKKTYVHLFRMKKFQQPNGCAFAMDVAASQGHVEVLEILQNVKILLRDVRRLSSISEQRQQPQCTSWAMDSAAFAGHLDVVQWLHFNRSEGCTTAAMDKAAVNGHLEVVKWLSQNRSEGCSSWALDMVASKSAHGSNDMTEKDFYKKQLQIFQSMYRTSASCTSAAMDGAAANGNLEMLKWLHENTSAGFTSKAMDMAAENGHLDIIEWLHSLKYSTCTTAAMDNAASNGHLDVVKWLHVNRSEGCTHAAMDRAAGNGHLNVLTWLHQHRVEGCTADALDNAADTGNFKMTKWLLSSWSKGVASTALVKAANNGHLRVVQCLAPRCTPQELVPGVREAVEHEHFEVALFLHSLCRHVNSIQSVLRRASLFFRGEIDLRRWMDENSQDGVHSRVRAFPP